jgi:hypothetical protein
VEIVIAYLPALACAAAMVVCVRMMGRHHPAAAAEADRRELAEVRARLGRLEAERAVDREGRIHG